MTGATPFLQQDAGPTLYLYEIGSPTRSAMLVTKFNENGNIDVSRLPQLDMLVVVVPC